MNTVSFEEALNSVSPLSALKLLGGVMEGIEGELHAEFAPRALYAEQVLQNEVLRCVGRYNQFLRVLHSRCVIVLVIPRN